MAVSGLPSDGEQTLSWESQRYELHWWQKKKKEKAGLLGCIYCDLVWYRGM